MLEILRNVLYMLQRNEASRKVLDEVYRRRTLETHLRSVKIFASLIPEPAEFDRFVEFLRPRVRLVRVHPGQVIVRQGDLADHFYMVRSGFVKVSETRQGIERVLNYIGPGGYFGEIGLLGTPGRDPGHYRRPACAWPPAARWTTSISSAWKRTPSSNCWKCSRRSASTSSRWPAKTCALNELQRSQLDQVPLGEFLDQGLMNAGNVLVLDLERCTRCDECTKACADSHGGVTRLIREGLRFDKFLVATSCRSCLDPYCLVGCPAAAIERTEAGDISHQGHLHRLRQMRRELSLRQYQHGRPGYRGNHRRSAKSGAADRGPAAEGDNLRQVQRHRSAELRLCLPARGRAPHGRERTAGTGRQRNARG